MVVIRFRNNYEHEDLLKKVKKMKKFTEDIESCLEDAMEEENVKFRGHYEDYEDDDYMDEQESRYRKMRKRMK